MFSGPIALGLHDVTVQIGDAALMSGIAPALFTLDPRAPTHAQPPRP